MTPLDATSTPILMGAATTYCSGKRGGLIVDGVNELWRDGTGRRQPRAMNWPR